MCGCLSSLEFISVKQVENRLPETFSNSFGHPHMDPRDRRVFSAWPCKLTAGVLSFFSETGHICLLTKVASWCNSWMKMLRGNSKCPLARQFKPLCQPSMSLLVLMASRNMLHICDGNVCLVIQFSWT